MMPPRVKTFTPEEYEAVTGRAARWALPWVLRGLRRAYGRPLPGGGAKALRQEPWHVQPGREAYAVAHRDRVGETPRFAASFPRTPDGEREAGWLADYLNDLHAHLAAIPFATRGQAYEYCLHTLGLPPDVSAHATGHFPAGAPAEKAFPDFLSIRERRVGRAGAGEKAAPGYGRRRGEPEDEPPPAPQPAPQPPPPVRPVRRPPGLHYAGRAWRVSPYGVPDPYSQPQAVSRHGGPPAFVHTGSSTAMNRRTAVEQARRLNAAGAKAYSADGCRWVTVGGVRDEKTGKRKGGSPVCIKDGRVVKGHPSLTGRKIEALKEPPEPQSRRAEARQAREYNRAVWAKRARRQGLNPRDLHQLAAELLAHDAEFAGERHEVLKRARQLLAHYGYDPRALTTNLRSGRVEDEVPALDVVADSLARDFPHHFAGHADPAERVLDFFREGVPQRMGEDEAYEQAFAHLAEAGPAPDAGGDTDFEFGANVKALGGGCCASCGSGGPWA
jgi:hypothetical protein